MSDQNNNSLYENSEYPSRRQAPRQRRPRKKHRRTGAIALKVVGTLFLVGLCTSAILCCFAAWYIRTVILPQSDLSLDDFQLGENSIMYYLDRDTRLSSVWTVQYLDWGKSSWNTWSVPTRLPLGSSWQYSVASRPLSRQ